MNSPSRQRPERGGFAQRRLVLATLPRRLVAVDGRVRKDADARWNLDSQCRSVFLPKTSVLPAISELLRARAVSQPMPLQETRMKRMAIVMLLLTATARSASADNLASWKETPPISVGVTGMIVTVTRSMENPKEAKADTPHVVTVTRSRRRRARTIRVSTR